MANTSMKIVCGDRGWTILSPCWYFSPSDLVHVSWEQPPSLPQHTQSQNIYFTVLYNLCNFHTLPATQTLIVSYHVQKYCTVVVVVSGCRDFHVRLYKRVNGVRKCRLVTDKVSFEEWDFTFERICRLRVTSVLSLKHRSMFLPSRGHINSGKLISLLLKGRPFWILKKHWPLWRWALRYF